MTREKTTLDFSLYLRAMRRSAPILILLPVLAAVVAYAVSKTLPPVYEAKASLLVRPSQPLAPIDPSVASLTSDQVSRTYASLMTQRPILEKVATDLNLRVRPDQLISQIKVTPQPNTSIIDVTVDSTSRTAAHDIADTLVRDFIADVKQIQKQETQAPNARSADNLVIVAPAVVADAPVSPRIALNVVIAAVIGLMAAVGLAVLREVLDQSIKSDEEITERTGLIPVGHVGFVAANKNKFGELVALTRDFAAVEAYNSLRTNLLFSGAGGELKTILVTSATPDEGKSRTAANLAVVLAAAGKRTLIVDADFRRPSQHRIFGKVRNVGLSNMVVQDMERDRLITVVETVPNLWFLPSGPTPPNPSELLGSHRVKGLIAEFRRTYDYVIIDSPPVNAVTDPSVLATETDGVILVAEESHTTYPALLHAKGRLDSVSARILGVVINKIRAGSRNYQYYDYAYYGATDGPRRGHGSAVQRALSPPGRRTYGPAPSAAAGETPALNGASATPADTAAPLPPRIATEAPLQGGGPQDG